VVFFSNQLGPLRGLPLVSICAVLGVAKFAEAASVVEACAAEAFVLETSAAVASCAGAGAETLLILAADADVAAAEINPPLVHVYLVDNKVTEKEELEERSHAPLLSNACPWPMRTIDSQRSR